MSTRPSHHVLTAVALRWMALQLFFLAWQPLFAERAVISLNSEWRFKRMDVAGAEAPGFDDSSWEFLSVPHTWNAEDGFDDQAGYYRGVASYRKRFEVDPEFRGRRVVLNLESACQTTEAWLNGRPLGKFLSGYVGFSVDITEHVDFSGKGNLLLLKIDNSNDPDIPPWNVEDFAPYPRSVDFNIYGGINGDVSLLITEPVRIESTYVTTPGLSAEAGRVRRETRVRNDLETPAVCLLESEVLDASGRVLESKTTTRSIEAGAEETFIQEGPQLTRPHLWSPRDPYLYRLRSRLTMEGRRFDEVETSFGMRWFEWKPFHGLYLNGEKLYLRGVSRHQEFPGQGNAMSNQQHGTDMELIKSMGANYVRLAHYPQDPAVLEACDRLGLVVWEEIPVAISVSGTPEFNENALLMLRRMIRRDRNHPSILFWGLMNEATEGIPFAPGVSEQDVVDLVIELEKLAREEDPTRLTLVSGVTRTVSEHVDLDVPQFWKGWFEGEFSDYGKALDERHGWDPSFMGGSYGASSQLGRHTQDPEPLDFSETYQCLLHESYIRQGEQRSDWYAGACAWTAFDFGSNREDRATNPLPYVNQKGLFDAHRRPKDVYYLYKSYWSEDPRFVYIVSKTWLERSGGRDEKSTIRAYSNCPRVELFLNGASQGITSRSEGLSWRILLREGSNRPEAKGLNEEGVVEAVDELTIGYRTEP